MERWSRPAADGSSSLETFDLLDPGTRALHVFERSAHRPWAEEPDEYFRTVKAFLVGSPVP